MQKMLRIVSDFNFLAKNCNIPRIICFNNLFTCFLNILYKDEKAFL